MKFAVLASGSGTNLQALLDAESGGQLGPAEIALVVCNRPSAKAIERGNARGKPTVVIDHKQFSTRVAFENAMLEALAKHAIDGVILAGFMRVLTANFIGAYRERIINTHPALCPAFPGINAPRQALDHGVKITGATVHFVDDGVDTGPIIEQAAVAVLPDDDPTSLHRRIQFEEHRLLPRATRLLAEGRLRVSGRRVRIESGAD